MKTYPDKAEYSIRFNMDARGRGTLAIHNDSLIAGEAAARTGSIDKKGALVNAITAGVWTIREKSTVTQEPAMQYEKGKGWKVRLWTPAGQWSHYLIHPDGGKVKGNGTAGCIGLQGTYPGIRETIDRILDKQTSIKVYINMDIG
jgi:hypothetical protein